MVCGSVLFHSMDALVSVTVLTNISGISNLCLTMLQQVASCTSEHAVNPDVFSVSLGHLTEGYWTGTSETELVSSPAVSGASDLRCLLSQLWFRAEPKWVLWEWLV